TITEEEIADRSKGDYLSKTIVLFQMTWFIGQCIARGAYGLTVTELELVTVAFASLTGVTYYLWWDKPLDVHLVPLIPAGSVSIIFGAIHCIAWDFHFATWQERSLWRITAVLVSSLPISMLALAGLSYLLDHRNIDRGAIATFIVILVQIALYTIARIILLVLPFIALRSLPPGAYVQLNWISFLPHI
ncbi:hypothetical protein M413DRAFT_66772, partial [Hebeloma cylindrosporum]